MVVLILTACPPGLRGHVTRWLLEVSAGVYVGHVSARVRDLLWDQVVANVKTGKAILIYPTVGEQRLAFKTHLHDWEPVDFDGITLMRRPTDTAAVRGRVKSGWSNAAKRRRYGR